MSEELPTPSGGRLHTSSAGSATPNFVPDASSKKSPPSRKLAEAPIFQKRNWMLYHHYVRQHYQDCWDLIKMMKEETKGLSWYGQYVEGLLHRVDGKIQNSLEAFRKASILEPKNADTKKQIGISLFLLGRHQLALDAYDIAQQLDGRDWEIRHNKGMCYVYLQEPGKAREEFLKAMQYNQPLATFKQLGALYEDQNELDSAKELYERGLTIYPHTSGMLTSLGLLYLKGGNMAMAFEKLGTAVMFGGKMSEAAIAVGSIMQMYGDIDPALNKYSSVASFAPESPHLWNNIGMCYYSQSSWVTAIACLKRANYLAPLEWKINYNLGLVHLVMQQDTTAFHFLKAAVHLNYRNARTYMLLAIALTRLNENDHAEKCYEKCLKYSDSVHLAYLNYATMLARQEKNEPAKEQLNRFYACCERLGEEACQLNHETLTACKTLAGVLGVEKMAPAFVSVVKSRTKKSTGTIKARRTSGQPV